MGVGNIVSELEPAEQGGSEMSESDEEYDAC